MNSPSEFDYDFPAGERLKKNFPLHSSSFTSPYYYDPNFNDFSLSATLPEISLKHPYDPDIFEGSSFRSNTVGISDNKGEEFNRNNDGNKYSSVRNVEKLNHMLGEVESLLKGKAANLDEAEATDSMNSKELNETAAILLQKEMTAAPDTLKTKIDKYVIPVLAEISDALSSINKTNVNNVNIGNINTNTTNITNVNNSTNVNKTSTSKKTESIKLHNLKMDRGCNPTGIWSSNSLGLDLNVTLLPNLMLKVDLKSLRKNGLIDKNWFMEGITMSKRGGPLIIIALDPPKRKIAAFIGQCKICQAEDYLFGSWTFSTCAPRCTDVWSAMESKMDVLKR